MSLASSKIPVGISAISTVVPDKVVTNFDLEKILDTTDEWIVPRTGIRERRVVEGELSSDLGARAALKLFIEYCIEPDSIDLLVLATTSPDMVFPSTATVVHKKIGLKDAPAFDVMAACTGFSYALDVASCMAGSGAYKRVLLVCAETMSRLVDWNDRSTAILFGDGAAAMLIEPVEEGYGVLASHLAADGQGSDHLLVPGGGSEEGVCSPDRTNNFIKMNGNEVFRFAVRSIPDACEKALEKAGLSAEDVDLFVPHQANKRIIDAAAEKLCLPSEKVVVNIERYGNTSTASIPLALTELMSDKRVKYGDVILTAGVGGGFTWGANVIRWAIK